MLVAELTTRAVELKGGAQSPDVLHRRGAPPHAAERLEEGNDERPGRGGRGDDRQ